LTTSETSSNVDWVKQSATILKGKKQVEKDFESAMAGSGSISLGTTPILRAGISSVTLSAFLIVERTNRPGGKKL